MVIDIDEPFSIFYNYLFITPAIKKKFYALSRRAGQPHLNAQQIKELSVLYPNIDYISHFVKILESINVEKNRISKGVSNSELLFQSLLQKAFKGELIK